MLVVSWSASTGCKTCARSSPSAFNPLTTAPAARSILTPLLIAPASSMHDNRPVIWSPEAEADLLDIWAYLADAASPEIPSIMHPSPQTAYTL